MTARVDQPRWMVFAKIDASDKEHETYSLRAPRAEAERIARFHRKIGRHDVRVLDVLRLPALLDLLARIEWEGSDEDTSREACPMCGNGPSQGHDPECAFVEMAGFAPGPRTGRRD